MGAPGSGKGTISKKIDERFDLVHVSTGDLFRQIMHTGLDKSIKEQISQGHLVPDDIVIKVVLEKLDHIKHKHWILDGFPRTLKQAHMLEEDYPLHLVINLKVPFEQIIERVKDRVVHIPSGRTYNLKYKPPKVEGKDDVTGEPLTQRPDDKPDAVLQRLKLYASTTDSIVDFYRRKGVLVEYSGTSSDELWKPIEAELRKHMKPRS